MVTVEELENFQAAGSGEMEVRFPDGGALHDLRLDKTLRSRTFDMGDFSVTEYYHPTGTISERVTTVTADGGARRLLLFDFYNAQGKMTERRMMDTAEGYEGLWVRYRDTALVSAVYMHQDDPMPEWEALENITIKTYNTKL